MNLQEKTRPPLFFPSRTRKYARLTPKLAYESMVHLLREDMNAGKIEAGGEEKLSVRTKLGGMIGAAVDIQIVPEGDLVALELRFGYRRLLYVASIIIVALIGVSLAFSTPVRWYSWLVFGLILPLAYWVNFRVQRFLDAVNEAIPHLEQEHSRMALMEDRKRWQLEPKDTEELHRRLREKHVKTWGNTRILEYKIAEYEGLGLTRNEAVRKAAEEEGIH